MVRTLTVPVASLEMRLMASGAQKLPSAGGRGLTRAGARGEAPSAALPSADFGVPELLLGTFGGCTSPAFEGVLSRLPKSPLPASTSVFSTTWTMLALVVKQINDQGNAGCMQWKQ